MLKRLKHPFTQNKKQLMKTRMLRLSIAALVGLALAGGLIVWQRGQDEQRIAVLKSEAQVAKVDGKILLPPGAKNIGGSFTLTDQNGKTVSDSAFRGKYLLVYFGYTYCPDMCPTGLSSISHALDQLGDDAAKVQPLYITIDPARDTPEKLKEYIAGFYPSTIALTGTAAQIAAVAKEYQVYYAKSDGDDSEDYVMDHTSLIYFMDPDGKFIGTFDEEVAPSILVKAIRAQFDKAKP